MKSFASAFDDMTFWYVLLRKIVLKWLMVDWLTFSLCLSWTRKSYNINQNFYSLFASIVMGEFVALNDHLDWVSNFYLIGLLRSQEITFY